VPSNEDTLAPPGEYDYLGFLRPTGVHNPNSNQLVDVFLHRSQQSVAILFNKPPLPPLKLPLPMGDLELHVTHDSLITQMESRSVEPFLHR